MYSLFVYNRRLLNTSQSNYRLEFLEPVHTRPESSKNIKKLNDLKELVCFDKRNNVVCNNFSTIFSNLQTVLPPAIFDVMLATFVMLAKSRNAF